jgi:endonuclease-3 related protein
MASRKDLMKIYDLLTGHFGNLNWWPADSPFEVMVGAVLTQNTAWTNVEKAIAALKELNLLSPEALWQINEAALSHIIRPSGYYRVKARRLKSLVRFLLDEYDGSIDRMRAERLLLLREKLLCVNGIGPETADSILLYACGKPVFVSDAYTKRIFLRHGLIPKTMEVTQISELVMSLLPGDAPLFNQFHALLVNTGKHFCRKLPNCTPCPLRVLLPGGALPCLDA